MEVLLFSITFDIKRWLNSENVKLPKEFSCKYRTLNKNLMCDTKIEILSENFKQKLQYIWDLRSMDVEYPVILDIRLMFDEIFHTCMLGPVIKVLTSTLDLKSEYLFTCNVANEGSYLYTAIICLEYNKTRYVNVGGHYFVNNCSLCAMRFKFKCMK